MHATDSNATTVTFFPPKNNAGMVSYHGSDALPVSDDTALAMCTLMEDCREEVDRRRGEKVAVQAD